MFERRKATIEVTETEDKKIELDLAEKEKSKTVSKAKLVTKAIRKGFIILHNLSSQVEADV